MRSISRLLVVLVALTTLHLAAEPLRKPMDDRGSFRRAIRVIKAILGVSTHGDGLTPPTPAPRP